MTMEINNIQPIGSAIATSADFYAPAKKTAFFSSVGLFQKAMAETMTDMERFTDSVKELRKDNAVLFAGA